MMDEGRASLFGLGGVSSGPGFSKLSPYLNVDPSYLQAETPEFIFNQEQKRGRLENSFTAIGTSVLVGAGCGGPHGLYEGVRQAALSGLSGKLRRTQVLNHTLKSGARMSNSLGSLAVIYSSLYCLISLGVEEDVEWKSCLSGALTGGLYKSTAGAQKSAIGAAVGLGIASFWVFLLKKSDKLSNYV